MRLTNPFTGIMYLLLALLLVAGMPARGHAAGECGVDPGRHADLATKIAYGHAFTKHSGEFVKGVVIARLAFPDKTIEDAEKFAEFLTKILDLPSVSKSLTNSRAAYWDSRTGTVIIFNPLPEDCGTAFRPTSGKAYFDNLR
ncbi:hypothetical protein FNA46_15170 [Rhizobium straminoryzae]|uniref:Uncharacterized protein n=2 Tax=Rhizobium straminoryzae TaxID=1387186 RepID=A0A549T6E2_9HYPH|nr:hypothetical protein FNA46_15170 [Rhizobium straminoryzae]